MEHNYTLQQRLRKSLREGSEPASPSPRVPRPGLAPGYGRPGQPYDILNGALALYNNAGSSQDQSRAPAAETEDTAVIREVQQTALEKQHTSSSHYHGTQRRNPENIPNEINCCIFAKGLPSTLTVRQLLHELEIRQLGKVAAVHINPPAHGHTTCAVKVTMWTRAEAERLTRAFRSRQIAFESHRIQCYWNKHKEAPRDDVSASRVVYIIGPPRIVSPSAILPWFAGHFHFKMDQVIVQVFTAEIMVVEYRFGSYINQASNAYKLIRDTYDPGNVAIAFGRDPCEPRQ
ncbi:hypothetical protein PG990_013548 [Apiospora arundinis]